MRVACIDENHWEVVDFTKTYTVVQDKGKWRIQFGGRTVDPNRLLGKRIVAAVIKSQANAAIIEERLAGGE